MKKEREEGRKGKRSASRRKVKEEREAKREDGLRVTDPFPKPNNEIEGDRTYVLEQIVHR